jgi:hypothetical protein
MKNKNKIEFKQIDYPKVEPAKDTISLKEVIKVIKSVEKRLENTELQPSDLPQRKCGCIL